MHNIKRGLESCLCSKYITLALPVVPDLKITDLELVDAMEKRVVPLLLDEAEHMA